MRKLIRRTLAAYALLFFAATSAQAAGSSGIFTVSRVVIENGNIFIFGPGIQNPDHCQTSEYVMIKADTPSQAYFLSVALTARASGRPISLWMNGCLPSNWHTSVPFASLIVLE